MKNEWLNMISAFEENGFTFKYKNTQGGSNLIGVCYTKKWDDNPRGYDDLYVDVYYVPVSDWMLISCGDNETMSSDWDTLFAGRVTGVDSFNQVIKMVMYEKD